MDLRDSSIPKSASLGMILSAVLLVTLGILTMWLQFHSRDDVRWVNHTKEVKLHIAQFLSVMQDAETGQRGYLITGREDYLEPYDSARNLVDHSLVDLRRLTADNLYQQEILDEVELLVNSKLAELNSTIVIRRDEGMEAAMKIVLTDDGKKFMDEIRKLTERMNGEEERLLELRNRSVFRTSSLITTMMILNMILILAVVMIACIVTNRAFVLLHNSRRKVRDSEERFDLAVRGTSEGIWDWDITTNKEWRSEQFYSLLGYEQGELKDEGPMVQRLLNPEDKAPTHEAMQAHLEDRVPYDVEFRLRTKSGNYRWFRSRGQAVWDETGRPLRMAGSMQDISERKQSQDQIAQREKELADFFDNAAVGLHWVGPDGIILRANQCELDLLGYAHEEYVGHHIAEFHADQDVIEDILNRLLSGKTLDNYPARLRSKDGSVKHVLICSNVYKENEEFTHTRCFTRDVTARKIAEDELLASEARMRAVLNSAVDAIVTIDTRGRIESFNPAAERMFGYEVHEVVGNNVNMLMPSPYKSEHDGYLANYLQTGKKKIIGIGREVTGLRKDGSIFPLELTISEVRQDSLRLFTGILRDLTERTKAETDLERYSQDLAQTHELLKVQTKDLSLKADELALAQVELRRANQAKSEFLANMSHELRTPLNAVIGFSEGLLERTDRHPLNDHQIDRLGKINKSGQHLLSLINRILDISKVESGKSEVEASSFDLRLLAKEVADINEGAFKEKTSVRFHLEVDENLPPIHSDRDKIKQMLINLVGNALKFTDRGEVTLQIRYADDSFLISVQDTGVGIPADEVDKVFDKFHQIRQASPNSIKGTGLGLSICKMFAELLGATLGVNSVVGVGSTFTLCVPPHIIVNEQTRAETLNDNLVTL